MRSAPPILTHLLPTHSWSHICCYDPTPFWPQLLDQSWSNAEAGLGLSDSFSQEFGIEKQKDLFK